MERCGNCDRMAPEVGMMVLGSKVCRCKHMVKEAYLHGASDLDQVWREKIKVCCDNCKKLLEDPK